VAREHSRRDRKHGTRPVELQRHIGKSGIPRGFLYPHQLCLGFIDARLRGQRATACITPHRPRVEQVFRRRLCREDVVPAREAHLELQMPRAMVLDESHAWIVGNIL